VVKEFCSHCCSGKEKWMRGGSAKGILKGQRAALAKVGHGVEQILKEGGSLSRKKRKEVVLQKGTRTKGDVLERIMSKLGKKQRRQTQTLKATPRKGEVIEGRKGRKGLEIDEKLKPIAPA